jgi:late competence protein required for DNA uptake (superfamily II DNA/RNA helicase)
MLRLLLLQSINLVGQVEPSKILFTTTTMLVKFYDMFELIIIQSLQKFEVH